MTKKRTEEAKPKTASIIDFIKFLTTDKKKWEELSIQDQKAFQPYMINKWLSMDLCLCEAVNEIQQFTMGMDKDIVWKLYYQLLPKQKVQINYIKSKVENVFSVEELDCFIKYFLLSRNECENYLIFLKNQPHGDLEIDRICNNFIGNKK